jgi:hypothetical protein
VLNEHTVKAKAFYSSSDRELKENIVPISNESIEKVKNVDLKQFNFKDDKDKNTVYGVIAQDVQSVGLDNLVHKGEDNKLGVDYTSFLLLKIASLEKTIESLSAKIDILTKKD